MELRVSFRGKALVVQGVGGLTSIADLKEKLAGLTSVPTDNQKLVSYCCTAVILLNDLSIELRRACSALSCTYIRQAYCTRVEQSAECTEVYLVEVQSIFAVVSGLHGTCG